MASIITCVWRAKRNEMHFNPPPPGGYYCITPCPALLREYQLHTQHALPPSPLFNVLLPLPFAFAFFALLPRNVCPDPLGRFVGHLHSVLEDRHREISRRCAGEIKAERRIVGLRGIGKPKHDLLQRRHPRFCEPGQSSQPATVGCNG